MKNNFVQAAENIFFKRRGAAESQLQDAAKFVSGFTISSAIIYLLLSLTGSVLNKIAAYSAAAVANNFFETTVAETGLLPHLQGFANGVFFDAEISALCSGALELAVMGGLVFASRDKPFKERLKGIFLGTIVLLVFNPIRIFLTLSTVGTPLLIVFHDALFRISLVILLAVFYALWYYWK